MGSSESALPGSEQVTKRRFNDGCEDMGGQKESGDSKALYVDTAPVVLHIYDLGRNEETWALNRVLRVLGTGAFHCGVEVYGKEYSYRGTRRIGGGTGVFCSRPKCCEGHRYSESMPMGSTSLSEGEVRALLKKMEAEWPGDTYCLFRRNCCHFADKLCKNMGVGGIPFWVKNLAEAGALWHEKVGLWTQEVPMPMMQGIQSAPGAPAALPAPPAPWFSGGGGSVSLPTGSPRTATRGTMQVAPAGGAAQEAGRRLTVPGYGRRGTSPSPQAKPGTPVVQSRQLSARGHHASAHSPPPLARAATASLPGSYQAPPPSAQTFFAAFQPMSANHPQADKDRFAAPVAPGWGQLAIGG